MKVGEFYKYKSEGSGYSDAEILAIDGDWVVAKYHPRNGVPYVGQPFAQKTENFLMNYAPQKPKRRFWLNLYVYGTGKGESVGFYRTKGEADKHAVGEYFVSQLMVEFDEKETHDCKRLSTCSCSCKCNCS